MSSRLWQLLDDTAHALNRVHLMPRRLGRWICDRFDLSLGLTREELRQSKSGDFTDDDTLTEPEIRERLAAEGWQPVEAFAESLATDNTQDYRTLTCEHFAITAPGVTATCPHGCDMQEVSQ